MDDKPSLDRFWLVQRMMFRDKPLDDCMGVDRFFQMDYMGAAEFEWGALPEALKLMRKNPRPTEIERVMKGEYVAWYIGPQEWLECASEVFHDQLRPKQEQKARLKERTHIRDSYIGGEWPWKDDEKMGFTAWWVIKHGWILFTKEEHARIWIETVWP